MKQSDGSSAEVGHPDLLKTWEAEYRAGKKETLPKIVAYCLAHKKDPPDWAKKAFIKACLLGEGPWESDFGRRPKAKIINFRKLREREALYDRIEELRKTNPVDPALFERVAKEFKVSAGTASNIYYSSATRGAIADRAYDVIGQLMDAEIGPDADDETRNLWWEQNAERIQEIIDSHHKAAYAKRRRNPRRIISKKSRRKN
jgi:hypothetical protein